MIHPAYRVFFTKALKFLLIFLIVDNGYGWLAGRMFFSQSSGKYHRITHSLEKEEADILVFGSSHANRHFVPEVFEEQTGKSCYNMGVQGQKILFHSTLQDIVLNRTTPDLMILNVDPDWMYHSQNAYDRLADLHPYYTRYPKEVRQAVNTKGRYEYLKLYLQLYRYNSTLVHILRYALAPQYDDHGYRPLQGRMKPLEEKLGKENGDHYKGDPIDPHFVDAFRAFIQRGKERGIAMIFVVSPILNGGDYSEDASFQQMEAILKEEGYPLYNFMNDERFYYQHELFNDRAHLNDDGARLFSKIVLDKINELNLL
jgi:hypothetical protein